MHAPEPHLPEGWRWLPGVRQAHARLPDRGSAVVVFVAEWGVEVDSDLDAFAGSTARPELRRLQDEAIGRVVPELEAWLARRHADGT